MQKSFLTIFLLSASLSACSWSLKRSDNENQTLVDVKQTTEAAATTQSPEPAKQEVTAAEVPAPDVSDRDLASKVHAPTPATAHGEKVGVDPDKALGWLKNGNTRFKKHRLRKDGQSMTDIKRLSTGQAPHTIVLSCSDSRVPPEVVFDQKLGEIFVVRNAGEIPDEASVASIEYAIEHLGARLILVMGHTSCGAVKAAIATMGGADAGSPALNALVRDIHPRIASFKSTEHAANVQAESWANAKGIAKDLISRSEIIREKVEQGKVKIKSVLYNLADGNVEFDSH